MDHNEIAENFAESRGITLEAALDCKLFGRSLYEFSNESLMLMLAYFAQEAEKLKKEKIDKQFADMRRMFEQAKVGG